MATVADALEAMIERCTVTALIHNHLTGETIEGIEVYPGKRGSARLVVSHDLGLAIASNQDGQVAVICQERLALAAGRAVQKLYAGDYDTEIVYAAR